MDDDIKVYDESPKEVKAVLDSFDEMTENSYLECNRIISELKPLGYTADYGLDAVLCELKKL